MAYIIRVLGNADGAGSVEALVRMAASGQKPPNRFIRTFDH